MHFRSDVAGLLFVALIPFTISAQAVSAAADEGRALANMVLQQMRQQMMALESISYVAEQVTKNHVDYYIETLPAEYRKSANWPAEEVKERRLLRKGALVRAQLKSFMIFKDGGIKAGESLALMNDRLTFVHRHPQRFGYAFRHESIGNSTDAARVQLYGAGGYDVTENAYGYGAKPLWLRLEDPTLDVIATAKENLFVVRVYEGDVISGEFTVDADRGFLIVHHKGFNADGSVNVERHITPARFEGYWLPAEIRETHWRLFQTQRIVSTTSVITLKDVRINPELPDDQFALKSLDAVEGMEVHDTDILGRMVRSRLIGGQLVPLEIARQFQAGQ